MDWLFFSVVTFRAISTIFWDIFLYVKALDFFRNIRERMSEWEKYSTWLENRVRSFYLQVPIYGFRFWGDGGTPLGHLLPYISMNTTQHSIMQYPDADTHAVSWQLHIHYL